MRKKKNNKIIARAAPLATYVVFFMTIIIIIIVGSIFVVCPFRLFFPRFEYYTIMIIRRTRLNNITKHFRGVIGSVGGVFIGRCTMRSRNNIPIVFERVPEKRAESTCIFFFFVSVM